MSDSQVLGDLLDQIPQDERVDSVYTDGAYDTKQCRQVIADRQAHAVIHQEKMRSHGKIKRWLARTQ
ncbi:ISSpo9, transposase family protein [Acinetobacter nosocomialis]|nr:ISSpo9, transposase family protein [Acinetobacter nosocomialis]